MSGLLKNPVCSIIIGCLPCLWLFLPLRARAPHQITSSIVIWLHGSHQENEPGDVGKNPRPSKPFAPVTSWVWARVQIIKSVPVWLFPLHVDLFQTNGSEEQAKKNAITLHETWSERLWWVKPLGNSTAAGACPYQESTSCVCFILLQTNSKVSLDINYISRPCKSCWNIIYDLCTQVLIWSSCSFSLMLSPSTLHTSLWPFLYLKPLSDTGWRN